jgi:cytochrome c-type biogenesis protein CcmH
MMSMNWIRALIVLLSVVGLPSAQAVQPDEILPDPALETRARDLSRELRCMVCQNQSIDDSDAPLARDLRLLVRERLRAGDSDTQIRDFLVARYGDFVLLKPRFTARTALLWLLPFVVLAAGAAVLLALRRRQRNRSGSFRLSDEEERRLAEVLRRERL